MHAHTFTTAPLALYTDAEIAERLAALARAERARKAPQGAAVAPRQGDARPVSLRRKAARAFVRPAG